MTFKETKQAILDKKIIQSGSRYITKSTYNVKTAQQNMGIIVITWEMDLNNSWLSLPHNCQFAQEVCQISPGMKKGGALGTWPPYG